MYTHHQKGITVLEILFSIAILSILSLIGLWHWSRATDSQALLKDREGLVRILAEARSLAISSKGALRYGVHLETDRAVLFEGDSYNASASTNKNLFYNSRVEMSAYTLEDGGRDIVFSRLNGSVENPGTIRLSLKNNSMSSTTVTVKDIGVIE